MLIPFKLLNKPLEFVAIARRLSVPLRTMTVIVLLNLVSIVLEGIGIGMLLPIFEVLQHGKGLDFSTLKGWYWDVLRDVTASLGVPLSLGTLLLISFTFLVIRQCFAYFNSWYQRTAARGASHRVRERAFRAILRSRTGKQDKIKSGEVVGDLTVELDRAHAAIFTAVRCVRLLAQIAVYLTGLILLSPLVTALCVGLIALIALSFRRMFAQVSSAGAAITRTNARLSAFVAERARNLRLVRLSGMEESEASAFSQLSRRHADELVRQKMVTSRMTLLPEPIAVGFAYVVVFVGFSYFNLGLDRLGLFVIVLARLMPLLRSLMSDFNTVIGQWPSVSKLDKHLGSLKEHREDAGGGLVFTHLDKDVRYENVSLRYGKGESAALKDVTVRIPAHKMTALVGPSGAGKSSFVDLLPRLRDPTEGGILFDGIPIENFSTRSVRAGIAFVPQQAQIMEGTVAEHIGYGKTDSTAEDIREAARIAGALSFIEMLPEGFNTKLNDGGRRLSGGQRQRLDIARALNRGAPILILDEPTSSLDALSESAFRQVLRDLREKTNRTIIVIAHRMSTIADADQIVVFSAGGIEAVGTHQELLERGGWYATAYRHQMPIGLPHSALQT